MRKKILMLASLSLVCGNVFAQIEKNPYVEKMQQDFQQASNQAQAQFEKTYPAPKVTPTPNQKITPTKDATPPKDAAPAAQTVPPPVVPTPPKPQAYVPPKQESQPAAPAKKVPDIAVNSDSSSSTAPNIYAPGGSSSQSNNSSTYNPYR